MFVVHTVHTFILRREHRIVHYPCNNILDLPRPFVSMLAFYSLILIFIAGKSKMWQWKKWAENNRWWSHPHNYFLHVPRPFVSI